MLNAVKHLNGEILRCAQNDKGFSDRLFISRRQLLQIGGLGFLGLNLPRLFQAEAAQPALSRIKSCILIFYYGGPSHVDTFDMKPDASSEIRGEFKPVRTKVPGLHVCEHLPMTARVMDKVAVVRSMHHPMRNHNSAAAETLTGRTPLGGDQELLQDEGRSFPSYGSALNHALRERKPMPTHVALPHVMYNVVQLPGQTAGFLGADHNPLLVSGNANAFRISDLELPANLTLERLEQRKVLLRTIDWQMERWAKMGDAKAMNAYYEKAFSLLGSEAVRRSLDISQESPRTRDRYGRNVHGQSVLMARRLVEAGVRFVSVYDKVHNGQDANWDSHEKVFSRLKDHLLPPADQAFSALVEDLDARGLLNSTLVVAMGEFGRTPKINGGGGRDHWPDCYSILLAGGGVTGSAIYGSSDATGAYPESDGVTPADLAATLFWRFGIDPVTEMPDLIGRPWKLSEGEPMRGLF
jgi:hypothetical protein